MRRGATLMLWLFCSVGSTYERLINTDCGDRWANTYDYLLVGAGSAGSIIAARLTENPKNKVFVLEAGLSDKDHPFFETAPLRTLIPDSYYWIYEIEPQQAALFAKAGREKHGKVLGGTSTTGSAAYYRGFKSEYDYWEQLGADGWSYADVLPYFKKTEGTRIEELKNSYYHNTCGPLAITNTTLSPAIQAMIDGIKESGLNQVDCNIPTPFGICTGQLTIENGKRTSTSSAFLWPAMERPNLDVLTNATVTKVLIHRRTKQAIGVQFVYKDRVYRVFCRKEVILSAGGYGSPKILLLSGIGPRAHLQQMNIPVVSNVPVGESLQVQPEFLFNVVVNVQTLSTADFTDPNSLADYVFRREGVYASRALNDAGLNFQTTPNSRNLLPEIHIMVREGVRGTKPEPSLNTPERLLNGYFMLMFLAHPKSHGTVRLRSRFPLDHPRIDPRILTAFDDIRSLIKGFRRFLTFLEAPSLRRIGAQFEPWLNPNCTHFETLSDEYLECLFRYSVLTSGVVAKTCKMGNRNDPSVVVDSNLRVIGVRGLRVADISVMPELTSRTYASAMMIGEKASDLIKADDKEFMYYSNQHLFDQRKNYYSHSGY